MGTFHFKQFDIDDHGCGMKICSDSVTFGAWFFPPYSTAKSVIDIGTGSGLLSLIAAQFLPEASIIGLDIDEGAVSAASLNFKMSPWAERLKVEHTDFSKFTPSQAPQLIICNPPFFTNGALASDKVRASARHEDSLTIPRLMHYANSLLTPTGHLGVILPSDRTDDTIFHAELAGMKLRRMCEIIPKNGKAPIRTLFDFSRNDGPSVTETLFIRDKNGCPSNEYINLVDSLYIKIS